MAYYNPITPPLLLVGSVESIQPKDLYGVDNGTGLSTTPLTYTITIDITSLQSVGDETVREGTQYNGIDVKVGDFVAQITGSGRGLKVLRIQSISFKSTTSITCVVEDVDMIVEKHQEHQITNLHLIVR